METLTEKMKKSPDERHTQILKEVSTVAVMQEEFYDCLMNDIALFMMNILI